MSVKFAFFPDHVHEGRACAAQSTKQILQEMKHLGECTCNARAPQSSVKNGPAILSITANCMFSDGLQWRLRWLINQLLICLWSSPVDSASAILSASWMRDSSQRVSIYFDLSKMYVVKKQMHKFLHRWVWPFIMNTPPIKQRLPCFFW